MKKEIHSLEDLVDNPSFINWVYQSNTHDMEFWDNWLVQYPTKRKLVEDAAMVVRGVVFKKQNLSEEEVDTNWIALEGKISQGGRRHFGLPEKKYAIAATIALIVFSAISTWFLFDTQTVEYTTKFGEIRHLVLPDSSVVTLNANSTLTYDPSSFAGPERKVFLKGEAFFKIIKKNAPQPVKFVVVTEDAQVEVLGTTFNVNDRRGKTRVVLNSGKVKLNVSDDQSAILNPGEMAEYSKASQKLTLQQVDPEVHSAWRKQKLKFDDTSLVELAEIIEDNFGLEVVIKNPALRHRKITGEISAENVEIILSAVSKLFQIQISRSGNIIYLS